MPTLALLAAFVGSLALVGGAAAAERPVAIVTAETTNQVIAVSLGPRGGHVVRRVHFADPLMVAAPLHGPAVVVSPTGRVTLLAPGSLRPIKVFRSFRSPKVAAIAPGGRYAYVSDEGSGEIRVIDLLRRRVAGSVHVGLMAHHLSFSPDGTRLWVALGETATTIVRLDTSHLAEPRVVGRFHPRYTSHDVKFAPDGRTVWVSSSTAPYVTVYDAATGKLEQVVAAARAPQHLAFSGARVLISSGYGSSLQAMLWRTRRRLGLLSMPYGSFNLVSYGGTVVTTSLFTGMVTELRAGTLHRFWSMQVAPAARYVAISLWPR